MKRIIPLLLLVIAGCAQMRQVASDISAENVQNVEAMREIAQSCIPVWDFQSGFLKGALGDRINELPHEAVEAINELDRIADLPEQSDYEMGYFLGLKVRLTGEVIQVTLEKYAPNMGEFLPLVFLF